MAEHGRRAQRRRADRQRPLVGARDHQQVLGEARQPVGLLGGRPHGRLELSRAPLAQRQLELGPQDRQRRAQLVAGVGDEHALALERGPQPGRRGAVARQRRDRQRHRPADEQQDGERAERLVTIVDRRTDDEDLAVDRRREEAHWILTALVLTMIVPRLRAGAPRA